MTIAYELAQKELAFEEWIQKVPTRQLECRVNRHKLPDWSDKRAIEHKFPQGDALIEQPCLRKCGTSVTTYLDVDGYILRPKKTHYYDPEYHYLMPPEARGPGLTKERIARIRLELIGRKSEWITEE